MAGNVDELETHIDEGIRQGRAHKYFPTTFIRMRAVHGTVGAIEKLVQSGELQTGFKRLRELNLLEWTIEAAVLKFPNRFSKATQESAAYRLRVAKDRLM